MNECIIIRIFFSTTSKQEVVLKQNIENRCRWHLYGKNVKKINYEHNYFKQIKTI